MSGGSWDYLYQKIEDAADRLQNTSTKHSCCEPRRAFGSLLYKVARAMHSIEWVDSCDYGPGDELKDIKMCFEEQTFKQALLEELKSQIVLLAEKIKFYEIEKDKTKEHTP